MRVVCVFRETTDEPTNITPINAVDMYEGLANLGPEIPITAIMDLAGSGFLNNGEAVPMETDTDSYRYGVISEEVAKADGTFDNPLGVTIAAANNWDTVTIEVRGQYGDSQIMKANPVWANGQTTIYINRWNPGERVYITGVYLGVTWIWDNSNLLSVNVDLRGVNTEIGGELEVSTIEIRAYEPTIDPVIIGRIPQGAPIWYYSGYNGDMSERRTFYLSEGLDWDENVLSVKGQDASMFLDNVDVPVDCNNYGTGWFMNHVIGKRIRAALSSIDYDEVGTPPVIGVQNPQVVLYEAKAARSIISEYTGLFRDGDYFRVTYVDAGRPTLTFEDDGSPWTIYADEIADFNIIVERNKKTLKIVLPEYYLQHNDNIEDVETTAGKTYFVELDPPVPKNNIWISPTPTSYEEINCSLFKFVAAEATTYTIRGYETLPNLLDANNPYSASETNAGEVYSFDFGLPLFYMTSGGSLTKLAVDNLLDRSNIVYEFNYRGNPHIQPRDVLNVEIATWETAYKTVTGLYPALDLYPDVDLYPYATYKKVRKMVKRWEIMTVDTVTLEHTQAGGLTSKIRARKGVV